MKEIIVHNNLFQIVVDTNDSLKVVHVSRRLVELCSYFIISHLQTWDSGDGFHFLSLEDGGLSIVCDESSVALLKLLLNGVGDYTDEDVDISPADYVLIHLRDTSSNEFQGALHHFSKRLSESNISIFHISTFSCEIFLVPSHEISKATVILKKACEKSQLESYCMPPDLEGGDASLETSVQSLLKSPSFSEGFELTILSDEYALAELNIHQRSASNDSQDSEFNIDGFYGQKYTDIITKLLLFDGRYSALAREYQRSSLTVKKSTSCNGGEDKEASQSLSSADSTAAYLHSVESIPNTPRRATVDTLDKNDTSSPPPPPTSPLRESYYKFLFGVWSYGSEVTFLLNEADLDIFPHNMLTISPQKWTSIRLGGRPIGYQESGIVSAMTASQIHTGGISLNVSTSKTNCTLVPAEILDDTLQLLSVALNCAVPEYGAEEEEEE